MSLGPSDLVVEIVKLGVPIRVLGAFFRLAIRLQRVAELVQQSVDEARTHRMAQGLQLDRQLADALRRPSQGAVVRRPGGDRFEQGIEVRQQRHVGVDAPLAAAARPTHTAGVQRGVRPQFLQAASDPGPRHPRGPGHLGNAAMPQRLRLGGGPQAPRALVQHRRQSFVLRSQSLFGIHTSRITPFRQTCSTYFDPLPYAYLGHWQDRGGNSNVEKGHLTDWLRRQDHSNRIIDRALFELDKAAAVGGSKTLYEANRGVYGLLRYGVKVQPDVGEQYVTVPLIDWETPRNNDFGIAQEVTVPGENTRRPDLILYVNGIALGVLELKRSTVSVAEGIRQNLDSQKKEFIQPFFATVQFLMAGNDTEGCATPSSGPRRSTGCAGRKPKPTRTPGTARYSGSWASSARKSGCWRSSTISWSSTPATRRSAGTTNTSA